MAFMARVYKIGRLIFLWGSSLLLLQIACLDNPYDTRNIPSKFAIAISKQSLSAKFDTRPFIPLPFSLIVPNKEYIDSIVCFTDGPDTIQEFIKLDSIYKGLAEFNDTGIFKIHTKIFVADYKGSVFDTSFSVRVEWDIFSPEISGLLTDSIPLIAHATRSENTYFIWRIEGNELKTFRDTTRVKFKNALSDSIEVMIADSNNRRTSPKKVRVNIKPQINYSISITKFGQGSIIPTTQLFTVKELSDTFITARPARNYKLDSITVNNESFGNDTTIALHSINSDKAVRIYFSKIDTIGPVISDLYPIDSAEIGSPVFGYQLNKYMSRVEVRWISMPYGAYDPLSPHIMILDSMQRLTGAHQINDTSIALVPGAIYNLQLSAQDTLGISSSIIKSSMIIYRKVQ
jgi:hypothetical protein